MPKAPRTLRSRYFRLLASTLVMLAIVSNGIVLAQTQVSSQTSLASKDCCAQMMGDETSSNKPCSMPDNACNDQCMARCMSANGMLSVPFIISNGIAITPLPQLKIVEHALAEFGPGLRPPIFA